MPNYTTQDENVLNPWIDPHQLKRHQNIWYKDGRQVITGDIKAKRYIIQSHHVPWYTDTQVSAKPYN
jgi:hypothetical protein